MHNLNATPARVSRDSHDRSILKARLLNRTKWARDHVARRVMRLLLRYVNALHNLRVSVYIPMTPPIDLNTRFSSSCFRSTVIRNTETSPFSLDNGNSLEIFRFKEYH